MSVLFFDSFDHYTHNTPEFLNALKREYTCSFSYGVPHLLQGRHSDHSLYLGSLGVTNYISKRIENLNNMTFFVMGFQFKKIGNQTYTGLAISFADPIFDPYEYNKILFYNNEFKFITTSETSSVMATINDEEWHHIEMKMFYPGTGTWCFYVDGVQTGTWTPSTTFTWNKTITFTVHSINPPFVITSDASKGWYIDDFYLLDNYGSNYNNIIGPNIRIETLLPIQDLTAESTKINTSNGYQSQDNIPINTTQYINATIASGQTSTFEYQNLSVIKDIGAVKQNAVTITNDAINIRNSDFTFLKNNQESGATLRIQEDYIDDNKNVKYILFNNDPETDAQWDISGFNSSNFGFKLKNNNINITTVKDSMSDLYFPTLTSDNLRFESNAYVIMFSNSTSISLNNPNENVWTTINTGTTAGIIPNDASNYMLIKKKLNGLENDTEIAVQQSVSNHSFALMFITSSKDENFYFIESTTKNSGNQSFSNFNYQHSDQRVAILPIRILAPIRATAVNTTTITNTSAWTEIATGLNFSKFYYLTDTIVNTVSGYPGLQNFSDTMQATSLLGSASLMNILIAK